MSSSGLPAARSQPNSARSLKLVITALIVSNILMGTVSVMLLRSLDRRYTEVINRTVPALNDLRALSAETFSTFRALGTNALFNAAPTKQVDALAQAGKALEKNKSVLASVVASEPFAQKPALASELREKAARFNAAAEELMQLFGAGKVTEANQCRENNLRPAFDVYLESIAVAADEVESAGLRDSDATTVTMEGFSKIMIGLASWPFLVIGGLLLVTGLFVLVLMVAFRGREMSDAP